MGLRRDSYQDWVQQGKLEEVLEFVKKSITHLATKNEMRWIEMSEEQASGKTFNPEHLASEKKAFDEAEAAIKDSISIYKEMINYWSALVNRK